MKFNFKRISAVTSSLLVAGMSVATPLAAANYPKPFIDDGSTDVAIVHGTGTGVSSLDLVHAGNIQSDLQDRAPTVSSGDDSSVEGEAYPLFTESTRIYAGDSIATSISTLTDSKLPTLLEDSEFSGDTTADVTQRISLSTNPTLEFGKHPTSDDDPTYAFTLGTTSSEHIYNLTVSFSSTVDLTASDSVGEKISLFGKDYTVGASTTTTNLYLFESSETIDLSIGADAPSSTTVNVDGEQYTVELVSASDNDATLKVTDSAGESQTKTVNIDDSSKIEGVEIAVDFADETNNYGIRAQITVGANKVRLTDNQEVRQGADEDIIEGTKVQVSGTGALWNQTNGFDIMVFAEDTDVDAITEGGTFVDPVFGNFKIDFSSLENMGDTETLTVESSGNDEASLKMTSHSGDEATVEWYYNESTAAMLGDSTGDAINVREGQLVNKSEYVVLGNENTGYLLELKTIYNSSQSGEDYVEFEDVFSGTRYKSDTETEEGTVELFVESEQYTVTYVDDKDVAGDEYVTIDYPDSTEANSTVMYPTIETSKGANVALYEPLALNLNTLGNNTVLYFPDGDGYEEITITEANASEHNWTFSEGGTLDTSAAGSIDFAIGNGGNALTYNVTRTGNDAVTIYLEEPGSDTLLTLPSIVMFEEDDEANKYNALVVKMEGAGTDADGVGVSDVLFTASSTYEDKRLESDTDLYKSVDYFGTLVTQDNSESDQNTIEIVYPDQQVYAKVYAAEGSASIGGDGESSLGDVLVKDTEVSSVENKNLIIVGGSCINSAAADVLGGDYCGAQFTEETEVGPNQFLIQGIEGAYTSGKLALLVAGYEAQDTVNAATYLRTQEVDTSKKYIGSSSTSADLVTEEA